MRIKQTLLVGLMLALSPMAANADPIAYSYDGFAGTGMFTFEEPLGFGITAATGVMGGFDVPSCPMNCDWLTVVADIQATDMRVVWTFDAGATATGYFSGTWATAQQAWGAFRASGAYGTFTQTVPEPGTLALFGIGLAGMGLARRRHTA